MMNITEKAQEHIADYFKDKETAPITVDFTEVGFKIETAMMIEETGCAGCSSAGSR